MKIKAITLYQPWASLVAYGAKKIETRSWPTKYRGPLAIHAALNRSHWTVVHNEPFRSALTRGDLPYGNVICACRLVDCLKVVGWEMDSSLRVMSAILENGQIVTGNELAFGNYSTGRFAWILEDIKQLPESIPAKGMQGLWNWEVPEGVILPGVYHGEHIEHASLVTTSGRDTVSMAFTLGN